MKKIKLLIAIALVVAAFTSCSKDEVSENEVQNKEILSFNSEKEMNEKIAEIEKFKANQEADILEKILKRNNLKAPTAGDFKNIDNATTPQLDEKAILEDVKFYHKLKLEAIYAERAHFGFTSIQSIADEINFNKLVNPEKAKQLLAEYEPLLINNEFLTTSSYNKAVSTVINLRGELLLNKKNIAEKFLMVSKTTENLNTARSINSGILVSGYNNFISITYSTDLEYSSITDSIPLEGGGITFQTTLLFSPSTTLSCFVMSAYGYVLYPCYFYTNPSSYARFTVANVPSFLLGFQGGIGTNARNQGGLYAYTLANYTENITGVVSGNFAVPIAGTQSFLWVSGSKSF